MLLRIPFLTNKRISVKSYFESINIELGEWFTAPLSSKSIDHSLFGYEWGSCPQAEFICDRIINLPLIYDYKRTIINKKLFNNLLKV